MGEEKDVVLQRIVVFGSKREAAFIGILRGCEVAQIVKNGAEIEPGVGVVGVGDNGPPEGAFGRGELIVLEQLLDELQLLVGGVGNGHFLGEVGVFD